MPGPMLRRAAAAFGGALALAALAAHAAPLAYEPVALGWSAEEVDHAVQDHTRALLEPARQAGRLGCSAHCERLHRIFEQLLPHARGQSAHAAALSWELIVVRQRKVEAMALPGGQVIISEDFVADLDLADEEPAFVIAHEMAHSVLEHERQALSFARLLLPRHVQRSVNDMYAEMDHNFSLLRSMEPVLHQGEFEADELGLMLASVAGYSPLRQLPFLERLARLPMAGTTLLTTHPTGAQRSSRLQTLLPLAQRLYEQR